MQWWQKNMHDGFRFVMLLQSAYMWATMVFIKKGAPNQTSSCMDANCKPFQALKEASSRLCTYTHTWDQIHTFFPFALSMYVLLAGKGSGALADQRVRSSCRLPLTFMWEAFVHSHLMIQMAAVNVRKLHARWCNDEKHFVTITYFNFDFYYSLLND
jgi:hypothetical protein